MDRIVDKIDNFVLEEVRGRNNTSIQLTDLEAEELGDLLDEC